MRTFPPSARRSAATCAAAPATDESSKRSRWSATVAESIPACRMPGRRIPSHDRHRPVRHRHADDAVDGGAGRQRRPARRHAEGHRGLRLLQRPARRGHALGSHPPQPARGGADPRHRHVPRHRDGGGARGPPCRGRARQPHLRHGAPRPAGVRQRRRPLSRRARRRGGRGPSGAGRSCPGGHRGRLRTPRPPGRCRRGHHGATDASRRQRVPPHPAAPRRPRRGGHQRPRHRRGHLRGRDAGPSLPRPRVRPGDPRR